MKKRLLFLFACSLLLNNLLSGQIRFGQLLRVNACWQDKEMFFRSADKSALPSAVHLTEQELVATHLRLVWTCLQNNPPHGFTESQLKNRANCLAILDQYIKRGVFPQNLYHSSRTPYFIDDSGTACAVGHLMIRTGGGGAAGIIHRNDNYGYIMDLAPEYPQISEWAETHGFTLEELAWIQPTYGCQHGECLPGAIRQVSCKDGFDGCVGLTPPGPGMVAPFVYSFYYKTGSNTWQQMPMLCDLWAGQFKTVITGANGATEEFLHTITEPAEALVTTPAVSPDQGNCNGSISLQITGGIPPYSVAWDNGMQGQGIFPLCAGEYVATITDGNGCQKIKSATVGLVSAEHAPAGDRPLLIYPNPATNLLYVDNSNNAPCSYRMHDLMGREIRAAELKSGLNAIDLGSFPAGNYIFSAGGNPRKMIAKL